MFRVIVNCVRKNSKNNNYEKSHSFWQYFFFSSGNFLDIFYQLKWGHPPIDFLSSLLPSPLGKAGVSTLTWSSKLVENILQLWFVWCFKYTKIIPASGVQIFKFSKLFILSFSWIWNEKNISSKALSYFKISNLWLIQSIINPWWCWELPKALTPIFLFLK